MDGKEFCRIIEQLLTQGEDLSIENINKLAGRELISRKAIPVEVNVSQARNRKDSFTVTFNGTGIDIENEKHTDLLGSIIKFLTVELTKFAIVSRKMEIKDQTKWN